MIRQIDRLRLHPPAYCAASGVRAQSLGAPPVFLYRGRRRFLNIFLCITTAAGGTSELCVLFARYIVALLRQDFWYNACVTATNEKVKVLKYTPSHAHTRARGLRKYDMYI